MAYITGTAANSTELLQTIATELAGLGRSSAVSYTGTGNGVFTKLDKYAAVHGVSVPVMLPGLGTTPETVTENWTVTCITASAGGGVFSVVGSVSGAQANATVGVDYDNDKVVFRIDDGSVDFQVGDAFTFSTTQSATAASGQAWEFLGVDGQSYAGFRGRGMSGTENIFLMLSRTYSPGNDIYGVFFSSATSFNTALSGQAGHSGWKFMSTWDSSMPFWLFINAQRLIVVVKVSTTYHSAYAGKFLPFASPDEYGYPMYVAADYNGSIHWSSTVYGFRCFADPGHGASMYFPSGVWRAIENYNNTALSEQGTSSSGHHTMPYVGGNGSGLNYAVQRNQELRENLDGTYSLEPITLMANLDEPGVFGELDGAYSVSGFANGSENVITVGSDEYIVFNNIFRNARHNYFAVKME